MCHRRLAEGRLDDVGAHHVGDIAPTLQPEVLEGRFALRSCRYEFVVRGSGVGRLDLLVRSGDVRHHAEVEAGCAGGPDAGVHRPPDHGVGGILAEEPDEAATRGHEALAEPAADRRHAQGDAEGRRDRRRLVVVGPPLDQSPCGRRATARTRRGPGRTRPNPSAPAAPESWPGSGRAARFRSRTACRRSRRP